MRFPIPGDWDGTTWCRWAICWPDSEAWRGLLRGFITLPMRGWTWDERTGDLLAVQQIGREIFSQNLPLDGVILSCNDDLLANAFNNIAIAIGNMGSGGSQGQCCGTVQNVVNNSIQGFVPSSVDGSPIPVYGSVPSLSLPVSGIPDGFETESQYKLNKCQLANQTVDGVAATLKGLGAITVFNIITLGGLVLTAIVSTIIFPPSAIPALLAMMLLLTGGLAILVTLGDLITEHRDELICALYASDTVEQMIIAVEAIMTLIVVALPVATALQLVAKGIAMMFFNSDTLNGMMTFTAALGYPDADCTSCECNTTGQAEFYSVDGATWGSGDLSIDCEERELSGGEYAAGGYWFVGIMNTGENDLQVESISADPGLTNAGSFGGMSGFGAFQVTPGNNIYFGGNSEPFTMVVKISGLDTINGV